MAESPTKPPRHLHVAAAPTSGGTRVTNGPHRRTANDPAKAVRLTVRGPRQQEMLDHAVKIAAQFLGEPGTFLYVSDAGTAHVSRRERFVPHLGVDPRPVEWELTCTVRLAPEIVKQRRGGTEPDGGCADPEPEDEDD